MKTTYTPETLAALIESTVDDIAFRPAISCELRRLADHVRALAVAPVAETPRPVEWEYAYCSTVDNIMRALDEGFEFAAQPFVIPTGHADYETGAYLRRPRQSAKSDGTALAELQSIRNSLRTLATQWDNNAVDSGLAASTAAQSIWALLGDEEVRNA